MAANQILSRLLLRDLTPGKIAKGTGIKLATVSHHIHGRRRNLAVQERIAELAGMSVKALFGEFVRNGRAHGNCRTRKSA